MKTTSATRLAFVLLAFLPSVAGATPILDQFQDDNDENVPVGGGGVVYANEGSIQSLTVGVTGILPAVNFRARTFPEVKGGPPGQVYGVSNDLATFRRLDDTGTPIWTADGVVGGVSFRPTVVDFGAPITDAPWESHPMIFSNFPPEPSQHVTAGERLAIVVEDPARVGGSAVILETRQATYEGGGLVGDYLLDRRQDPISPDPMQAVFFRTWVGPDVTFIPLPGDINTDGTVGLSDVGILKAHFGRAGARGDGDLTGDGRVDISDFAELKDNYGRTGPGPVIGPTVPEPAEWVLAMVALAQLAYLTRGRRTHVG